MLHRMSQVVGKLCLNGHTHKHTHIHPQEIMYPCEYKFLHFQNVTVILLIGNQN